MRAFEHKVNDQNYFGWDLINMAEDVYNAPSVFNFYPPRTSSGTGLTGGEFAIFTPYTRFTGPLGFELVLLLLEPDSNQRSRVHAT